MEKIILLEIFQPFAQYRNPFTFYYAQTYPLPPKTAIIGMLQNATNHYYDEKFWDLKVSIHGGFESVFWNYQNLIKGTKTGISLVRYKGKITLFNQNLPLYGQLLTSQRSPVYQQELFNGHLYIFLKGSKGLIYEIEEVLKNPNKILYLGRSEDVIFIRAIYTENSWTYYKKQVDRYFRLKLPTYIKLNGFPIDKDKFPVYSIGTNVVFKNKGKPIKNKAQISKETEREAEFETVIYTGSEYVITLHKPIELEYFKLGDKIFKIPEEFGWI